MHIGAVTQTMQVHSQVYRHWQHGATPPAAEQGLMLLTLHINPQ
jgi:hypothetical protein